MKVSLLFTTFRFCLSLVEPLVSIPNTFSQALTKELRRRRWSWCGSARERRSESPLSLGFQICVSKSWWDRFPTVPLPTIHFQQAANHVRHKPDTCAPIRDIMLYLVLHNAGGKNLNKLNNCVLWINSQIRVGKKIYPCTCATKHFYRK